MEAGANSSAKDNVTFIDCIATSNNETLSAKAQPAHPLQRLVHKANGIDALIICGNAPKKAVISFSSMNPGKYERWSWFHEKNQMGSEDLYIILKDDDHHYYLGDDQTSMHVRHQKFIQETLSNHSLTTRELYVVGSSMGGYAALYFGFWLNAAGIVAVNPQVDYQSSRRHSLQNWERNIRESGSNWVDLNDFIYRFKSRPNIHLEHGDYPADVSAAEKLIKSLDDLKISYTRYFAGGDHGGVSLTKDRLFSIIDFWSK